jgi:mRNA interferase MazF
MAAEIARGDIRLYRFAPSDKRRPVLVLTRHTSIQNLATVTIAPITSTIRGVPTEVLLTEADGMKQVCAVNLHNMVTVSKENLGQRVAALRAERLLEVCAAIGFALGCK